MIESPSIPAREMKSTRLYMTSETHVKYFGYFKARTPDGSVVIRIYNPYSNKWVLITVREDYKVMEIDVNEGKRILMGISRLGSTGAGRYKKDQKGVLTGLNITDSMYLYIQQLGEDRKAIAKKLHENFPDDHKRVTYFLGSHFGINRRTRK